MRAPHVVASAALALATSAFGEDARSPPPADAAPTVDVYGHLLATPDRVLFHVGRTRLDLRAAGGDATIAEPFGPPEPEPYGIRAYFNLDARTTSLMFRVPPPARAGEPR